jgi:hypothetical protein
MLNRWSATMYTCLMVALHVAGPGRVELTVGDHVRLDRVTDAGPERHGDLVSPGTTPLFLTEGVHLFRTTRDARVRLGDGAAVRTTAVVNPDNRS